MSRIVWRSLQEKKNDFILKLLNSFWCDTIFVRRKLTEPKSKLEEKGIIKALEKPRVQKRLTRSSLITVAISEVVQSNSATAEESSTQATNMDELVGQFQLKK